jgi:hypothetical protein
MCYYPTLQKDGPGEDSGYMTLQFVGIVGCSGQAKPEQG